MPDFTVPGGTEPMRVDYGFPISSELYEIRRERTVELAFEGHRNRTFAAGQLMNFFQGQRQRVSAGAG